MGLNRRGFLKVSAAAGVGSCFLSRLPANFLQAPAAASSTMARIAQMLIASDSDSIYDLLGKEIRGGASLTDVMGGVLLAGVREIEPRPVGFKLHAVMVVGSNLDLAQETPGRDRWLPVFWNAADFKRSQLRDLQGGDWVMPDLPQVPKLGAEEARARFTQALERWDEANIDAAAVALFPHLSQADFFELLWLPGARCFSNLGHKIIYTAQAYRALGHLGWRACGLPMIRSLVNGLLENKPGQNIDQYRANLTLADQFPAGWDQGQDDPDEAASLAAFLLGADPHEASSHVLERIRGGLGLQTIWDGYRLAAADFLFRVPRLLPVHPMTSLNGLRTGFQATRNDHTRKVLLLQAASYLAFYRQGLSSMGQTNFGKDGLLSLQPLKTKRAVPLQEAFDMTLGDTEQGQRAMLSVFDDTRVGQPAFDQVRENLYQRGVEHHQFKYTAAMFQECRAAHPRWAAHLFAGGLGYLPNQRVPPSAVFREASRVVADL